MRDGYRVKYAKLGSRAARKEGLVIKYTFLINVTLSMNQNTLSKIVLDSAFRVHSGLWPGLLEHVYEVVLAHELRKQKLKVARQVPIPIVYDGIEFEEGYRADLIVEGSIIVG